MAATTSRKNTSPQEEWQGERRAIIARIKEGYASAARDPQSLEELKPQERISASEAGRLLAQDETAD